MPDEKNESRHRGLQGFILGIVFTTIFGPLAGGICCGSAAALKFPPFDEYFVDEFEKIKRIMIDILDNSGCLDRYKSKLTSYASTFTGSSNIFEPPFIWKNEIFIVVIRLKEAKICGHSGSQPFLGRDPLNPSNPFSKALRPPF
ncbi:hypothetical protein RF11_09460 [Thelohanellus kitauei]|uniref:Uncharacterized protein n=1 Tax=Thelohanellus kitauei TaxID=669202 RepID=A0A0C2M8B6_THEKT|nr:hypothetical protein RF11_09460 [Thelohanellus kitauei]